MERVAVNLPAHPESDPIRSRVPWDALLVASFVVLLPIGRIAELPVLIALVVVIALCLQGRFGALRGPGSGLVFALFACYWLPILISGFGAVEPAKTWSTAASALRFLPFTLFIVAMGLGVPVGAAMGLAGAAADAGVAAADRRDGAGRRITSLSGMSRGGGWSLACSWPLPSFQVYCAKAGV